MLVGLVRYAQTSLEATPVLVLKDIKEMLMEPGAKVRTEWFFK